MNVPAACLSKPCCGPVLLLNSLLRILKKLKTSVFQTSTSFSALVSRGVQTVILLRQLLPRKNPKFFRSHLASTLVGRLGFEPRQRDSKSLDLPLVDRPVNRRYILILLSTGEVTLRTFSPSTRLAARSPSEEPARQRTGRAVEPPLHPAQTGKVQTEQSQNPIAPHTKQEPSESLPIN